MKQIQGKTALITGASRGLGALIAKTLARRGVTPILTARSQEDLDVVVAEIKREGISAFSIAADLSRIESLPALVEKARSPGGRIDILINNAGIESYQHYINYRKEDIQDIIQLNLTAPMELTRLVLPEMLERGEGHIVNISSVAGKVGSPFDSIYSGSKGGMLLWSNALRQELFGSGVYVSAVCPSYVHSAGMFSELKTRAPLLVGSVSPEQVAKAVVRALRKNKAEIIVYRGVVRPLLALDQLFPGLSAVLVRWFGSLEMHRKFADDAARKSRGDS